MDNSLKRGMTCIKIQSWKFCIAGIISVTTVTWILNAEDKKLPVFKMCSDEGQDKSIVNNWNQKGVMLLL